MGAIFCHVDKIKQFIQFNPFIILGNQKWNGAAPIFINKVKFIIIDINIFKLELLFIINKIKKNIKLIELKDWTKKYFKEASLIKYFLILGVIKGIKNNKFISNPIQHLIHELDEIANKVLIIKSKKNIILELFKLIILI